MSKRMEAEPGSLLPRGYEWVQRGVPAMFDRETDIRAIADRLMEIDRLRRSGDIWADFAGRLYDAGLRPTAARHECLVEGCPCGEMSAAEWRGAYFALAEIALKQQAEFRDRIKELPEVLDVALGYSVVRRSDVLAALPTQASDSPEKP